ncbi:MAG: right-handed parallel beta-helix repeat-containing protein, partial [Phycisphaerales bacterium]
NCLFQENSATGFKGGAIYASAAQLTLSDCRFIGNWAGAEGGAACCVGSELSLLRCTFETNSAWEGGAIHQTDGTLTLVECAFEGNAATQGGATAFAAQKASMTRCVFVKNWATGLGGAIESGGTLLTLDGCTFRGNTADLGGAVYAFQFTSPQVGGGPATGMMHCLFTGNRALGSGGALYTAYTEFTVLGCTFADNWAERAATLGWMLREGDTSYRLGLDNCIIWDGDASIAAAPYTRTRSSVVEGADPNLTIRYCDVQGGWPGEGNIDADPCFVERGYWVDATSPSTVVESDHDNATWVDGDYHLQSQAGHWDPLSGSWVLDEVTSPCIDAGDPNSPLGDEPEPNGGRINMGAYGGTGEASLSYSGE